MFRRMRSTFKKRTPAQFGWLIFLCAFSALWLLATGAFISVPYGYDVYAHSCAKDDRIQQRFEDLLFRQRNAVGMVGPDGEPLPNYQGPEPIAAEIAACFPGQVVGDKLLLPKGVYPALFQSAVLASFELAQGERDENNKWYAQFYPMNSPAASCVLAATKRLHRKAEASAPPPDPECRGMGWPYLGRWLLLGWGPLFLVVAMSLGVRRARSGSSSVSDPLREPLGSITNLPAGAAASAGHKPWATRSGELPWRHIRVVGLAVAGAISAIECSFSLFVPFHRGFDSSALGPVARTLVPVLGYWILAYLVAPLSIKLFKRIPP